MLKVNSKLIFRIAILLLLSGGVVVIGNIHRSSGKTDTRERATLLTIETVKELAKKGQELTWKDFEAYDGSDVGSGAYVYCYEMDNDLKLIITGTSLEEKPMYILLVKNDDTENGIDIRTEDIDTFLKK